MRLPPGIVRRVRGLLLDCVRPLLIHLDADYRIRAWSGDFSHYGLESRQAGVDCRELLPELYGIPLEQDFELSFLETRAGGSMDLRLLPMPDADALLVLTDSTDSRDWRQRIQQQANEIRLLNHRQEKLLAQLEQAGQLKSRFIAGMSHDFRTPLAAIQGQVELLRESFAARNAGLDGIDANAGHLLSLVDNLLDQAKIESGQLSLQIQATDLRSLGDALYTMFIPVATRKGLGFQVYCPDVQAPLVRLDPTRLRQILVNLLGNAFKYTERGRVELHLDWRDGCLEVAVSDTGPGIPAEARQRIFQAFHQEAGSREGVGLGLAISDRLVGLMGGCLDLESEPGMGSVFRFGMAAPVAEPIRSPDRHWRVLVSDDATDLRGLLMHLLRKGGFRPLEASNGAQTLAMAADESPDAVMLDLYLGEEDGCDVAAGLREQGYRGVILMLSASSNVADMERARAAGCDDFLVKTARADQLWGRLREMLG